MGKVLIIKNNNSDERIHRYAMESYEQGKKCYYNSVDGTLNEQALMELKKNFEGSGIVLMITYENSDLRKIKDVFIGDEAYINYKNSIEYIMRVYLKKTCHERVIASIIDKIDLDIDADFGYGQYVIMNDMESLFYGSQFSVDYNLAFASYLLVLAPVLIVYIFCQKWIMNGVVAGAVK